MWLERAHMCSDLLQAKPETESARNRERNEPKKKNHTPNNNESELEYVSVWS